MSCRVDLAGLTHAECVALARVRVGRGHGVAGLVYRDAMRRGVFAPEVHGLGSEALAAWRAAFTLGLPEVARIVEEPGAVGTTAKAVLRLADGLESECVLLPMPGGRFTLCVSSQVGCKMGCTFCETGRMGLVRNLSAAEIVHALLVARHRLGWRFDNLVFMGMGEALDNFDALAQALRVITEPGGFAMGQEKITVCTVGHVEGIRRLAAAGFRRLNLSVSLNAGSDAERASLMPIARRHPLAELQAALVAYRPRANFVVAVNYCLLPGINDRPEDADAIARFCAPLGRVIVHVIPYNPGSQPIARAPSEDEVARFIDGLGARGLPARRRVTKGRSVMAACGQLGNLRLRRARGAAGDARRAAPVAWEG